VPTERLCPEPITPTQLNDGVATATELPAAPVDPAALPSFPEAPPLSAPPVADVPPAPLAPPLPCAPPVAAPPALPVLPPELEFPHPAIAIVATISNRCQLSSSFMVHRRFRRRTIGFVLEPVFAFVVAQTGTGPNFPVSTSAIACRISSKVFITKGPYWTTGSPSGAPASKTMWLSS
jgi:hypothetical protein